jgi:hypothetical protein
VVPAEAPHDELFYSPWLKWGRAVVHAQALHIDLDTFGPDGSEEPTFACRADYHPKRHGFSVVVTDIDPMPPTWGLILGDVANNLRSACDQLAWALVTRGRTPPDKLSEEAQRRVYLPIAGSRKRFNRELPKKLPGVRRADIAVVRRYQPYHYGRRGRWFASLILADLNTDDKHRTVQPIWAIPVACDIQITDARRCVVRERERAAKRQVLKVGAELGFVHARKLRPNPEIDVIPHLAAEPMLEGRLYLREWLKLSVRWVHRLLSEFSEPPQEITRLGIDTEIVNAIIAWERPTDT